MALLNGLYVFVKDESVARDVNSTSHPVEKGVDITDHIESKPIELNISGKIVDVEGQKASEILSQIIQLKNSGSLINYLGRNVINGVQIQSFSTSHPYTTWGGCEFEMTLKEVRIAKPAYTPLPEAEKPEDDAGTQQVDEGENKEVYHTVKAGDTMWDLYKETYKDLSFPNKEFSSSSGYTDQIKFCCLWGMLNNEHAFRTLGDFRTLQIGAKVLIGYRNLTKDEGWSMYYSYLQNEKRTFDKKHVNLIWY